MNKEVELQSLKRLESFIKENMPRYKTRLQKCKLYIETIFNYLEVECSPTINGLSYPIYFKEKYHWPSLKTLIDYFGENQVIKFFKDLYDEEIRLEDKYLSGNKNKDVN